MCDCVCVCDVCVCDVCVMCVIVCMCMKVRGIIVYVVNYHQLFIFLLLPLCSRYLRPLTAYLSFRMIMLGLLTGITIKSGGHYTLLFRYVSIKIEK